jgi:hypothetical protein
LRWRRVSGREDDVVRESGVLRQWREWDGLMVDIGRDKHWRKDWCFNSDIVKRVNTDVVTL